MNLKFTGKMYLVKSALLLSDQSETVVLFLYCIVLLTVVITIMYEPRLWLQNVNNAIVDSRLRPCRAQTRWALVLEQILVGINAVYSAATLYSHWPLYNDRIKESMRYPNASNSRVVVKPSTAEIRQYQNTISGTSGHYSSTPMVAFDSQGMTSS